MLDGHYWQVVFSLGIMKARSDILSTVKLVITIEWLQFIVFVVFLLIGVHILF